MRLGDFINTCLRVAGDAGGQIVGIDDAARMVGDALAYAFGRFDVPLSLEYTVPTANATQVPCYEINPLQVQVNGREIPRVSRLDVATPASGVEVGALRGWYYNDPYVEFVQGLAVGDEVTILGNISKVPVAAVDITKQLTPATGSTTTTICWVPAALYDVVRYRVIQRMCEMVGNLEKAAYFGAMARQTERDAAVSYRPVSPYGGLMKGDDFLEF